MELDKGSPSLQHHKPPRQNWRNKAEGPAKHWRSATKPECRVERGGRGGEGRKGVKRGVDRGKEEVYCGITEAPDSP